MPESTEEREKRLLKELEGKNIAHYSVLLSSWIQTKMEHDKTLVTLSSGGIALLVTILTMVGTKNWWGILLYFGSFLGFGICIWSSLKIYQLNSEHIENELSSDKGSKSKLQLKKYDKLSLRSFIIGVAFFCAVGVNSAIGQIYTEEDENMSKKKETTSQSYYDNLEKKSLNGLENLRPNVNNNQEQSITSEQQDQSSNSSQENTNSDNKND